MENRPQGREKNVTGTGKDLKRRGSGLGTGPVGDAGGYSNRPGKNSGGRRQPTRGGGGGIGIIALLLVALLGGGGGLSSMLLGGGETTTAPVSTQPAQSYTQTVQQPTQQPAQSTQSMMPFFDYSGMFGSGSGSNAANAASGGWLDGNNTGKLNTAVSKNAAAKRTQILGNGKDVVTIMVYMCGTDLESQSAMGSKDLQEMLNAKLGSNVNLLVYTGGCRQWRNNIISSSVNQIYKVENGSLTKLVEDAGTGVMTNPKTLASFIDFCARYYPANRNMLILWDHGGGSISGYGYDEKNAGAGAMNLKGLDQALTSGKVQFDFIGFDACLMGSLETGLTMARHADYLIASEETEPGLGWYYTNWLTALSENTSMPTIELGRQIADDFVSACARSCPGQKTTLSVVDLAELTAEVPESFTEFSKATLEQMQDKAGFTKVSDARSSVREFSASTKTDQVDAVHLALKMGTDEGRKLADAILSAVKYNRTSSNMTNSYGLSLYFPYQKVGKVSSAVAAYDAIGMDDAYTECIRKFASMETGGQAAAGGTTSPMTTLSGGSYSQGSVAMDMIGQMLSQMLSGNAGSYGITADTSFFDRSLDLDFAEDYLTENAFPTDALQWESGVIRMTEEEWSQVKALELNVFADDGEGYIDLGLDTTFAFNDNGELLETYDGSWLAIDGQNIAYYHVDTTVEEDGGYTITGRVPVMLDGVRAELILVFTDEEPNGVIAGARTDYRSGETDTIAKGVTELESGTVIDFLCDYYTYGGDYSDSYYFGEPYTYTGEYTISNVYVPLPTRAAYRFTDRFQNRFWSEVIG